jgi:hypothetical protein
MRGRWLRLRTLPERPIRVWESWFQGAGQMDFHMLAERAGHQLSAFRVRLPAPSECMEILRRDSALSEDMLILPDEDHRWPKVLHWLGWEGKVMPVDRWGNFNGIDIPFDTWDESRDGLRPRSFYSHIDNLFLRSAAALEWMITRLGETSGRNELLANIGETVLDPPTDKRPNPDHGLGPSAHEIEGKARSKETSAHPPKKPRITREKVALYRKIVAAGHNITHGEKGKRIALGESFKDEIHRLEPEINSVMFVRRAFAYCFKHPQQG